MRNFGELLVLPFLTNGTIHSFHFVIKIKDIVLIKKIDISKHQYKCDIKINNSKIVIMIYQIQFLFSL